MRSVRQFFLVPMKINSFYIKSSNAVITFRNSAISDKDDNAASEEDDDGDSDDFIDNDDDLNNNDNNK